MPQLVSTHHKYAGQGYETVAVAMSAMTRRIMCVSTPARINCRFCDRCYDSTATSGGVARRLAKSA